MTNSATKFDDDKIKVAYLAADELKLAASLLFQAYHDDPVFVEIFDSNNHDYEQKLRAAIREELTVFWQAKQPIVGLYLGDVMAGVACLNRPDQGLDSGRFWHWRLKMLLGAGYFSTKQMIEKEKKVLSAVPMDRFHMLSFIAIHPLHQHHGFGHYLMAAVNTILEKDPQSQGVAVYATNAQYQAFFQDVDYQNICQVTVGNVSGSLMVKYRDNIGEQ